MDARRGLGREMRAGQFRIPEPRKRKRKAPMVAAAILVVGAVCAGALLLVPAGIVGKGATVTSAEAGQTREEIQAELDREVAENMMTVSVAPTLKLNATTHELRVNLENVEGNKFAQRFTISQGDEVIYKSDALMPGERIETVDAPEAEEGDARVEVQALDAETLEEHGSPTAVEVSVAEA
jgi:hypothetical protein